MYTLLSIILCIDLYILFSYLYIYIRFMYFKYTGTHDCVVSGLGVGYDAIDGIDERMLK